MEKITYASLSEQPVPISGTHKNLLNLTVQIVSAHIGHNPTPSDALPGLIRDIHDTLAGLAPSADPISASAPAAEPAARSVAAAQHAADDHLVCLEDGLTMKMLKRHLMTVHGLTPEQYRAKWGLPRDYPMVAANYAKLRSSLAKESGLGLRPDARPRRGRD